MIYGHQTVWYEYRMNYFLVINFNGPFSWMNYFLYRNGGCFFFFNMSKKYLKFPQLCMFTEDFCGDPKTSPGYCLFVLNRPGKVLATKTEAASWTLKQSTQNMWEIYYIIDHMYIHCRWGWIYSCSLWMEFHSITRIAGAILGFRCSMFTKRKLVFHRNTPGEKKKTCVLFKWPEYKICL